MCIRDRVQVVRRLEPRVADRLADLGCGYGSAAMLAARTYGCLLYTSDAADERSSVDLGGRRIIKKKNEKKKNKTVLVEVKT